MNLKQSISVLAPCQYLFCSVTFPYETKLEKKTKQKQLAS